MLDKDKINSALLRKGLSTKKSRDLAEYLASQDLTKDEDFIRKKDKQEVMKGG